jgi:hypothetical protein
MICCKDESWGGRFRNVTTVITNCGSLMEAWIPRCWSASPEDPPTFGEIVALFQRNQFCLLPNADMTGIRDFCEAIFEWERRAGMP